MVIQPKGKTIARQLSVRSHEHYKAYSLQYNIASEYNHSPTRIFPNNEHYECSVYIPTHACYYICHTMNDNDTYQIYKQTHKEPQ